MPNLEWPKEFKDFSREMSSIINMEFATEFGDANCSLGSNYCFRIMLFMCSVLSFQLAFPACVALARYSPLRKRISQERLDTLLDRALHGMNIAMMALHAPISKKVASLLVCTWYNDVHVIDAAKTIECGNPVCVTTGLVFFFLYTLGIPVYVWLTLYYTLSPWAREKYKGSPMMARFKARHGFFCGKYEIDFWYYELLQITQRTLLIAVASFIQRGSYAQLFAKLLISGGFFVYLVRSAPFNSEKMDLLVTTNHFCTLATLWFALMMKIGFFEEEGVPEDVMSRMLMAIMFLPLLVALYIISGALYEACFVSCVNACVKGSHTGHRAAKKVSAFADKYGIMKSL